MTIQGSLPPEAKKLIIRHDIAELADVFPMADELFPGVEGSTRHIVEHTILALREHIETKLTDLQKYLNDHFAAVVDALHSHTLYLEKLRDEQRKLTQHIEGCRIQNIKLYALYQRELEKQDQEEMH